MRRLRSRVRATWPDYALIRRFGNNFFRWRATDRFTPSSAASARCEPHPKAVRFAVVAQAVLAEACSRKEFFDELADNLEARSDRYTHQSGPGIIALF